MAGRQSSSSFRLAGQPEQGHWLVLLYKLPAEPVRYRATVWRKLKALGAVYLQDGVAALPDSAVSERSLRLLRGKIRSFGGSGQLMRCAALAGQEEATAAYNRARDQEYEQLISRAHELIAEVEQDLAGPHVTLSELARSDRALKSIKDSLRQVQAQDVLGAGSAMKALDAIALCENAVDALAACVFRSDESRAPRPTRKPLP